MEIVPTVAKISRDFFKAKCEFPKLLCWRVCIGHSRNPTSAGSPVQYFGVNDPKLQSHETDEKMSEPRLEEIAQ